jgi:hypothetical protein
MVEGKRQGESERSGPGHLPLLFCLTHVNPAVLYLKSQALMTSRAPGSSGLTAQKFRVSRQALEYRIRNLPAFR